MQRRIATSNGVGAQSTGDAYIATPDSKLRGREQVAHGTMAFHFDKAAGFKFKPGQVIDVVLLEPPAGDTQSARHTFSIVSALREPTRTLVARQPWSLPFRRTMHPRDAVQNLNLMRRTRGSAHEPIAPCLGLCVVPCVHQGQQGQGRISQPAEAIIPVSRPAQLFRQRCRGRRNNAAGASIQNGKPTGRQRFLTIYLYRLPIAAPTSIVCPTIGVSRLASTCAQLALRRHH